MIGLAKACNGGGALANYVLDEDKGYELDRNLLCGTTPKEIVEEMKMIQDLNQRAVNKTFSLVLSPDIKDGEKIQNKELKEITQKYLKDLGIDPEKQQYIAFVHTEKDHKHIHIIANRVQPNGKLISDHHIGKRGQWAAHEIAKERGLISAKEKMFENVKNISQNKGEFRELKAEIFKKHQLVMREYPKTLSKYTESMSKLGIIIKPTINNQGQLQGFRLIEKETNSNFKMSEINRSMSTGNLLKGGIQNDLNLDLDKTLQSINIKQISTLKTTQLRNIKSFGITNNNNKSFNSLKGIGKQKMTREKYDSALKFGKHFDEVIQPNIIIKSHHSELEKPVKDIKSDKLTRKYKDQEL
jgi:hypothetical protein